MAFAAPAVGAGVSDPGALVWASATASSTAAGFTTTATASLPQGAVGRPLRIKAFGIAAGYVQVQIGNAQVVQVPITPNIINETTIPQNAFPGPVNGITVVIVGFASSVSQAALVGFKQ